MTSINKDKNLKKHRTKNKGKKAWYERLLIKKNSDPWINWSLVGLILFGTIMIVSTSLGTSVGEPGAVLKDALKQGAACTAGFLSFYICDKLFSYKRFRMFSFFIYLVLFAGIAGALIFGQEVNGSRAWIYIGGLGSLQPSEMAKPVMIGSISTAVYYAIKKKRENDGFFTIFKIPFSVMMVTLILVFLQKDNGTMLIILGISCICFLVPAFKGIRKIQMIVKWMIAAAAVVLFLTVYATDFASSVLENIGFLSHVSIRLENMKDPYLDEFGQGYQPANSLYSIGDAGLFGKGIGNSTRKYGYLTQADSDYIMAVIVEETGIIGIAFITSLYGIIVFRLIHYAMKTRSAADKTLFCGTAAYLLLHFFINVGGVGALIPMTGVPLLFISNGGSSLAAACAAIGMSQSCISEIRKDIDKKNQLERQQDNTL